MNIVNRLLAKLFKIPIHHTPIVPFIPYAESNHPIDVVSQLGAKKGLLIGTRYHYEGLDIYDEPWEFDFSFCPPDGKQCPIRDNDGDSIIIIGKTEDFDSLALSKNGNVLVMLHDADSDWYTLCSFAEFVERMTPVGKNK